MLYEKLSGGYDENGTAHLHVFARIFPASLFVTILGEIAHGAEMGTLNEAIFFQSNSFLYNDLVRSTSLRTSTLSDFYLSKRTEP